ncbi:MAG: cupin domain-containing protein [Candidatus Paceibacterota bacterium]|jgi:mannose-6-phosphate isomerase-like protein (cupin superfamily)
MDNKTPFIANIEQLTLDNSCFRQVLYTAPHSQLVLMSLLPGEEIGAEVHHKVDQFFRFERGQGKVVVDGKEYPVTDGSALLVPAGLEHNIINTGSESLKLYTVYSPANHIDGRVHETKADAIADDADEKFGE